MGADFIITTLVAKKGEGGIAQALKTTRERTNSLTSIEQLGKNFIYYYMYDTDEDENDSFNPLDTAKEIINDAINELEGYSRETALVSIGEYEILITGGMSWGDAPTTIMESFDVIHDSGLYPYIEE